MSKKYIECDFRYLSESSLQSDGTIKAELARAGEWVTTKYGKLIITPEMLNSMADNFQNNIIGRKLLGNVEHDTNAGAISELEKVTIEGTHLWGFIKPITELADIKKRPYISIEYFEDYTSKDNGIKVGPTIHNYAHTIEPILTGLSPVILSETLSNYKTLSESSNEFIAQSVTEKENKERVDRELKRLTDVENRRKEQNMAEETAQLKVLTDENNGLKTQKEEAEKQVKKLTEQMDQQESTRKLAERISKISDLKTFPVLKNGLMAMAKGDKIIKLSEKVQIAEGEPMDQFISLIENCPVDERLFKELSGDGTEKSTVTELSDNEFVTPKDAVMAALHHKALAYMKENKGVTYGRALQMVAPKGKGD